MLKILFQILSANALALGIKLVSGFLFPGCMSTQDNADYQTFSLYLSYLPILSLGFPAGLFVRYGGQRFDRLDKARYKSETRLLAGILLVFSGLFMVIWAFRPGRMLLYITLCIFPYCLVCSYQSLYQTWGDFGKSNRTQLLTAAVPVLGSFALMLLSGHLEADSFILLFLGIYWLLAFRILVRNARATAGVQALQLLDETNLETWKTGISVCIGSYIHGVIHSLDKQIVNLVFDSSDFARYSFALSLQSVVMLFITALSQPMYHFLAKGEISRDGYPVLMRSLLMLGAWGGIAYYGCAWIVSWLLPNYVPSLEIVAVYFLVFPPMAVIQGLYVNLYKLHGQARRYVIRSLGVLVLSLALNLLLILWRKELWVVAAATVSVYYIWFLADSGVFRHVGFSAKDGLFLAGTIVLYLLSLKLAPQFLGAVVYAISLGLVCAALYRREATAAFRYLFQKRRRT